MKTKHITTAIVIASCVATILTACLLAYANAPFPTDTGITINWKARK